MNQTLTTLKIVFFRNERASLFSVGGILVLMVVLMAVASFSVLNTTSTKGYEYSQLQTEYQELVTDGEVNDMLNLTARSLTTIEENTSYMVKPETGDIAYATHVVVAQAD